MTDKEILTKAIEKAEGNGFDIEKRLKENHQYAFDMMFYPEITIFSHDFAKAFWKNVMPKEHIIYHPKEGMTFIPIWHYHLQQMVLCEEPLKYIEKFLKI